ncbi:hypothetical protein EYV94_11490 [Puteibacter caeruleilacunae]|nr:hypothetical protein EYV94_11490 [Puteibacter caeruleilacunae]
MKERKIKVFYLSHKRICVLVVFIVIMLSACTKRGNLKEALRLSGENKSQLVGLLESYSTESDSVKLQAAKYVISNLPGHYSYDTTYLCEYRTIWEVREELINDKLEPDERDARLKESWESIKNKYPLGRYIFGKATEDITTINSGFLKRHIDQAYEAYVANPYFDSISTRDFIEHVIPYKTKNGEPFEEWREGFYKRHKRYVDSVYPSPIIPLFDSILHVYKEYKYNTVFKDFPMLKSSDFHLAQRGICEQRCRFNAKLFASLGFPVAVDYVPAWGNRDNSHAWNALLFGGNTYAFESFWDWHRWKYRRIYNNINIDEDWGKFRLPKVFRFKYHSIERGPLLDNRVELSNIPPFFRRAKYEDVSKEYFKCTDVNVALTGEIPENSYYVYLCVWGDNRWKPVQWGEIIHHEVMFKDMGRDIVYLPAIYKNGRIIPVANAFYLDENGKRSNFEYNAEQESVRLSRKSFCKPYFSKWEEGNICGVFRAGNDVSFRESKVVLRINKKLTLNNNIFNLKQPVFTRYIRYELPNKNDVLAELSFYSKDGDRREKLKGKPICSDIRDVEVMEKALDDDFLSFIHLGGLNSEHKKRGHYWVGIDFGKKVNIASIGICPRNDKNNVFAGLRYELYYWNNQWISLGIKKAECNFLEYDNVPQNALLLLKCIDEGRENRIFKYVEGCQKWL